MAMEALETARLSPVDRPVVVGLLDMMAQRAIDGNAIDGVSNTRRQAR